MRGAYRRLLPKRLSSGGAREGLASLPLEGKAARRYAATDEVLLDLEALPAALEAVVTFPPHPPRCAQHLLLEGKAAHGPTVPAGRRHKKYRPSKRTIGIFGGGRWISPDGDKLRLHLPCKEKYRPSKRTIGIFGGGRWISPDGDKLRLHLPCKEKYRPSKRTIGIFGGGRWIRTIEGIASRFTVCPLWPLGNSPICNLSEGGAGRRTRTPDLLITNQLLYQLSYTSTTPAYVS